MDPCNLSRGCSNPRQHDPNLQESHELGRITRHHYSEGPVQDANAKYSSPFHELEEHEDGNRPYKCEAAEYAPYVTTINIKAIKIRCFWVTCHTQPSRESFQGSSSHPRSKEKYKIKPSMYAASDHQANQCANSRLSFRMSSLNTQFHRH